MRDVQCIHTNVLAAILVAVAAMTAGCQNSSPAVETDSSEGGARTHDGRPDFNGIWQTFNTANWNIQDHSAGQGPLVALGASFSVPGGQGVVVGNEIPYQPWALEQKQENGKDWLTLDPEVKCYLPGVPRAMYQPHPFQIVQTSTHILIAYEFADASRTIYMDSDLESPFDTWMGHSRGRWEGDTLVVDVTSFNDQTWFDRAGNFHSDALQVVERYTPIGPNHIDYEATITDPEVFTEPWTIRMPLYRRIEDNLQLVEYKCVEFTEELIWGHLRKQD